MRRLKGDTIIEVCFAIAVYSLVAVLTIILMNAGTNSAQASLEVAMARNEIDAQAEAIRFIHNSSLSERELEIDAQVYRDIWLRMTDRTNAGYGIAPDKVPPLSTTSCKDTLAGIADTRSFIINTRKLNPAKDALNETIVSSIRAETAARFTEAPLYPRVIFAQSQAMDDAQNSDVDLTEGAGRGSYYENVARAEGIWVFAVYSENHDNMYSVPEYYDFHIRTCWYAPGNAFPNTIGTIIRLYNPELVEMIK